MGTSHCSLAPDAANCRLNTLPCGDTVRYHSSHVLQALSGNDAAADLLGRALADGYMLPVFREQTLNIFKAFETVFSTPLGSAKELKKVAKALLAKADNVNSDAGQFHAEHRQFLRGALRELHLLVSDKPGLLGPKATTVCSALSFARGEIMWLFRHRFASEKVSSLS
jgi:hypothetical protein